VICSFVSSSGAEETIARVVDHHVDVAKVSESLVHDLMDLRRVAHIEMGELQPVAILSLEIILCVHLTDGPGDAAALKKFSVMWRPKPLFTPVINQARCVIF
jgi:hypothetical protein